MRNYSKKVQQALLGIFAVMAVALFVAPATATAYAQQQICGNSGSGYCINNWNGGGSNNQVKMYYGGVSHEDFVEIPVDVCHNNFHPTHTCPFNDTTLNDKLATHTIVELEYVPNGLCIGTDTSSGNGVLTSCGDSFGNGAGNGTIMVGGWIYNNTLIDRYWTNRIGGISNPQPVCSSGTLRGPLNMHDPSALSNDPAACQWGGLFY